MISAACSFMLEQSKKAEQQAQAKVSMKKDRL
jgi:hypothetical protein